jgi:outer membrane protein TolC
MKTKRPFQHFAVVAGAGLLAAGVLLSGCQGTVRPSERAARQNVAAVAGTYRPQGQRPTLPTLTTNSSLGDFLQFAMLNQPAVEAAYYDWLGSVERITVERSRPDPRFSLELDIKNIVETVMPGLMTEFPGPGKLGARARVAAGESEARYFIFENSVLQTVAALKRAYFQLHFLNDKVRVNQRTLELLGDMEAVARKQNEVGKATLQDVLRAQMEQDRLKTEIASLDDSRNPLVAQFKAALGLKAAEMEPPLPARFETTPLDLTPDQVLATAFARNPRLQAMEADVRRAEAAIRLAAKSRVPDFSVGIEADVKSSPVMVRPTAGMTLPVWRDKVRAEIAAAQAEKQAAAARLTAEQIGVAVELAEKSFMVREAARNLSLAQDALLPKARLTLEVSRASYLAGKTDFLNLIDAWRTVLALELSVVEARTQREIALTELSLVVAGAAPALAPFLPDDAKTTLQTKIESTQKSHAK